jgi:hypothetical protein
VAMYWLISSSTFLHTHHVHIQLYAAVKVMHAS